MSSDNIEPSLTPGAEPGAGSPGAMIREARTRLRMSIEELAAATKLARHTLDALERDDFNALQEPVYVRGYYRKCAKILQIDEARLAAAYQGRVVSKRPDAPAKLRLASGTEIGDTNPLPVPMAIGSALAAVLIGIVLWNVFKSPETPQAPAVSEEQSVDVEQIGSPETAAPATPDAAAPADPGAGLSTEFSSVPAATPAPIEPPTPAPSPAAQPAASSSAVTKPEAPPAPVASTPPPPAAPAPGVALALAATSTSWARIEDQSGRPLLNRLLQEGESLTLRGQPPFSVFLGNGPGVRVEFGGRPVDFSRHISDNLTARFRVPEGGS